VVASFANRTVHRTCKDLRIQKRISVGLGKLNEIKNCGDVIRIYFNSSIVKLREIKEF